MKFCRPQKWEPYSFLFVFIYKEIHKNTYKLFQDNWKSNSTWLKRTGKGKTEFLWLIANTISFIPCRDSLSKNIKFCHQLINHPHVVLNLCDLLSSVENYPFKTHFSLMVQFKHISIKSLRSFDPATCGSFFWPWALKLPFALSATLQDDALSYKCSLKVHSHHDYCSDI